MSKNRLVLRSAVLAALTNFGKGDPWPTLAGPHIYDSQIEPSEHVEGEAAYPVCIVYTDYDKDFIRHHGINSRDRVLTLTLELLVVQTSAASADEDGNVLEYTLLTPVTDSELETSLDIFEDQVFHALQADNAAANCFRSLVHGYDNVISRRGASVENGNRLAARQVTIEAKILRDCEPGTLPPYIGDFLDGLAEYGAFAGRVDEMRGLYTSEVTPYEKLLEVMGWSSGIASLLGYEPGVPAILGTPIRWLRQNGEPL